MADNGIFSEIYIFGLLGVIWFVVVTVLCLKKALKIYRKNGECSFLLFLLADLLGCLTLTPALFNVMIIMPLVFGLLDYEEKQF